MSTVSKLQPSSSQDFEDEEEDSILDRLVETLEYKQMQTYMMNNKFAKAEKLLSTILEL